jgi:hypothetical protein
LFVEVVRARQQLLFCYAPVIRFIFVESAPRENVGPHIIHSLVLGKGKNPSCGGGTAARSESDRSIPELDGVNRVEGSSADQDEIETKDHGGG